MRWLSKLGARDRNLLVLLVVLVTFYICYTFIMNPQMEKASLLRGEIVAKKIELESAKQLEQNLNALIKEEKEIRKELKGKYSIFFTGLNQANVLHRVDSLALAAGLRINYYQTSFAVAAPVSLEQGEYIPLDYPLLGLARSIEPGLYEGIPNDQRASSTEEEGGTPDSIPGLEIMVNFDGSSYESVYQFISLTERMNKTVIVKSIDLNESEGAVQGQLVLDFYALPRFDSSQEDVLQFSNTIPKGKANPFR